MGFVLGGSFLVLQAAFLDCQFLDLFPFSENGFGPVEVDIGRRDFVQALMITMVIVVLQQNTKTCPSENLDLFIVCPLLGQTLVRNGGNS